MFIELEFSGWPSIKVRECVSFTGVRDWRGQLALANSVLWYRSQLTCIDSSLNLLCSVLKLLRFHHRILLKSFSGTSVMVRDLLWTSGRSLFIVISSCAKRFLNHFLSLYFMYQHVFMESNTNPFSLCFGRVHKTECIKLLEQWNLI